MNEKLKKMEWNIENTDMIIIEHLESNFSIK